MQPIPRSRLRRRGFSGRGLPQRGRPLVDVPRSSLAVLGTPARSGHPCRLTPLPSAGPFCTTRDIMTVSLKGQAVVVLVSGGVESAALLAEALRTHDRVYPLYVRKGFLWEAVELVYLKRLLRSFRSGALVKLTILHAPVGPIYRPHWSLGKERVPGSRAPDTEVYLPGRNLLFFSGAGLFCSLRKIPALWIGILKGNPFQDARPGFLRRMERVLAAGLGRPVRIVAPFRKWTKGQVIRRWAGAVAWEKTFSCLNPLHRRHCGRCQKCAERRAGFRAAGVADPTRYLYER